jgi:hypothetical protein
MKSLPLFNNHAIFFITLSSYSLDIEVIINYIYQYVSFFNLEYIAAIICIIIFLYFEFKGLLLVNCL